MIPYITQVAIGKLECLGVFGDDYDTHDGTGVRDYIHVVDLAVGHVRAVEKLKEKAGVSVYNLGTGNGYSVLDMVKAFSKACGKRFLTRSNHAVQETLLHVTVMLPRQRKNFTG